MILSGKYFGISAMYLEFHHVGLMDAHTRKFLLNPAKIEIPKFNCIGKHLSDNVSFQKSLCIYYF